jgi:hypothetical protein
LFQQLFGIGAAAAVAAELPAPAVKIAATPLTHPQFFTRMTTAFSERLAIQHATWKANEERWAAESKTRRRKAQVAKANRNIKDYRRTYPARLPL